MKKLQLESVTETDDICVIKIQVMKLSYVMPDLEKCRTCIAKYYVICEQYRPFKMYKHKN